MSSTPLPKINLAATLSAGGGYRLLPETIGDFTAAGLTGLAGAWTAGSADFNLDGFADVVVGSAGSDDKAPDAGRVYINLTGTGGTLGDSLTEIIIDGVAAGDQAGAAVAIMNSMNGDATPDILIGAPGLDRSGVEAGGAYVLWGSGVAAGVDLQELQVNGGPGFFIKGQAAGDRAGEALGSIASLNGDTKDEVLIGAANNDGGGADAGAAYVVWGKSTGNPVLLASVAAGTGGYRIIGENAGDHAGKAVGAIADLNGDGLQEVLIGAAGNDGGGANAGAVYVVWGKATGTEVNLDAVALGAGGFKVSGSAGQGLGSTLAAAGDLNHDGVADIIAGTTAGSRAYVIFGQAAGTALTTADLEAGIGGFAILAEAGQSLAGMTVSGGVDLNSDGVADLLIGAPHDSEGGFDAGAVYVVWGGTTSTVDLSLIAQGIGGTKIVGAAGSLTGSSVQAMADANGDGVPDILIGSSGAAGEQVSILYTPDTWLPGPEVYGTAGADSIATGYGFPHTVGNTADHIFGLAGDDTISAAGGNDTVEGGLGNDSVDGGTGDNLLLGEDGNDLLTAGDGSNTFDGGAGADTMAGGTGADIYYVDDLGDVVTDTGGMDTVVISADLIAAGWTSTAAIETLSVQGTASVVLVGDAGANELVAGGGNDTIDGGEGDDTEIGGEGDDLLIAHAGSDTLVGGTGDDTYEVGGGTAAHIEDFQGDDTLDASGSHTDDTIDLQEGHHSSVEGEDIDLGNGGSTSQALDVQFLQDLTGSFGDDIAMVQSLVPQIVSALQAVQANSEFGVASFVDKGISPFGAAGEWVYRQEQALSNSASVLTNTYNGLTIRYGADEPEAQIESLMQLALHQTEVGFRDGSARFVILFTDAPFHQAGDGAAAGITRANNGDAIMDGGGIGEDYPMIAQVQAALEAANIIPIFAVANGYESVYQSLVANMGRGSVVSLTGNSSNVVDAIKAGLLAATTTLIEDAKGGSGNDHITGNQVANGLDGGVGNDMLFGLAGDDLLTGGLGNDQSDGGDGVDTAVFAGAQSAYAVVTDASTGLTKVVLLATGEADTLTGVESLRFTGGDVALADAAAASAATVSTTALVLDAVAEDSAAVQANALQGASSLVFGATLSALVDAALLPAGVSYDALTQTFTLDPTAAVFQPLAAGQSAVVTVNYAITDGVNTVNTSASFTVNGLDEGSLVQGTAGADNLTGTAGNDTLDGGLGIDTLNGGLGDDTYVVDIASDLVRERAGQGHDVEWSSVTDTLAVNVEDMLLTGAAAISATGNTLDNRLTGNDSANALNGSAGNDSLFGGGGADKLNGGTGADWLEGGLGSDIYTVDDIGDTVVESSDLALGGVDLVNSSVSFSLAAFLENLTLTGTLAIDGTGNDLANRLTGNTGANHLDGGAGNDVLLGGAGADVLIGGLGNDKLTGGTDADRFVFAPGGGKDTVADFALGIDQLDLSAYGLGDINALQFRDLGANTLITLAPGETIVLTGIADFHQLTPADFLF